MIKFYKGSEEIEVIATGTMTPEPIITDVPPVYVTTDKHNLEVGEVLKILGCTDLSLNDSKVVLEVLNPEGKIYRTTSAILNADGSFSRYLAVEGELAINGTYIVKATYAGQTSTSSFVIPEFPVNLMVMTAVGLIGMLIAMRVKNRKLTS